MTLFGLFNSEYFHWVLHSFMAAQSRPPFDGVRQILKSLSFLKLRLQWFGPWCIIPLA